MEKTMDQPQQGNSTYALALEEARSRRGAGNQPEFGSVAWRDTQKDTFAQAERLARKVVTGGKISDDEKIACGGSGK